MANCTFDELKHFYQGKNVLITGHTGFKGSWLSRILTLLGAKVTGYGLEPPTNPSIFQASGLEETLCSITGDIRCLEKLKMVFAQTQPEIVFHLAAQPIVRESYKNPVYTYETNVMGTVNVLECIRTTESVRSFLNVTTDKVYENREWEYGYRECDPLDGYDPYSNSKSCSELVTHSYQKSFFEDGRCAVSTSRAGNVIGGGDFAQDRIIPDCVRSAAKSQDIVVRNPYSIRPYQYVLEPLAVYLMIAKKQMEDLSFCGYYNVGPDDCDCITTGELADLFCRAWKAAGKEIKWVVQGDEGPHEANFLKLDCSRIKKIFGWTPRYHIQEAVEQTVYWFHAYLMGEEMLDIMDQQICTFFAPTI